MPYLVAWLVWGVATLLLLAGFIWLTRWIRPAFLKDLLRFLVAGVVLVPARGFEDSWAPAWVVFIFEAFLQRDGDPVAAAMMLVVGLALALVALIVVTAMRVFGARSSSQSP